MQIDLPNETIEQAKSLAEEGEDASAVIAKALEKLAWERQEVAAVMEGVADYQAGRHRPYEEFAAEFMAERGITREQ